MNMIWIIAGGAAFAVLITHLIVGGRFIMRPLFAAGDVSSMVINTHYYCWHLVSLAIAGMSGGFIYAGWTGGTAEIAGLSTFLAVSYCAWGMILPPIKGEPYPKMPQGWLFLPAALLGVAGFWV